MNLLLDTHVFLWYISGDRKLQASVKDTIRNPANQVYLSVASLWEAIVKHQIGKLVLPQEPEKYLPEQRELHRISEFIIGRGVC
jgi:PIN domain nuclease of toxin-antitoxin system